MSRSKLGDCVVNGKAHWVSKKTAKESVFEIALYDASIKRRRAPCHGNSAVLRLMCLDQAKLVSDEVLD